MSFEQTHSRTLSISPLKYVQTFFFFLFLYSSVGFRPTHSFRFLTIARNFRLFTEFTILPIFDYLFIRRRVCTCVCVCVRYVNLCISSMHAYGNLSTPWPYTYYAVNEFGTSKCETNVAVVREEDKRAWKPSMSLTFICSIEKSIEHHHCREWKWN